MKNRINIFIRRFIILFLFSNSFAANHGPETQPVPLSDYQIVYYVSQATGSDTTGSGTATSPWQTIDHALAQITDAGPQKRYAILVAAGEYEVNNLQLHLHVDLYGGFRDKDWQRNIFAYPTIIFGGGKNRLFIGAKHCRIDGFIFQDGRVRGKGGAIICDATSPTITNNIFVANKTLAPEGWSPKYRHEIASDGGAIFARNGAAPVIENNLFMRNVTEVGRGAAIALHGRCSGTIRNNVFLYNTTGLTDPRRSSDGGAVSVFDWSNPLIENNIFLGNQALNKNDGGALFVALWSSPVIRKNIFVGNRCDDDGGALFVGGQEHRYDRPFDKMPPAEQFFVEISENVFIGNANPSVNSGAMRMTMETRGRFQGNVCAFNTGIYFQRSEVEIAENVILDDFLCVETRAWLQPYRIHHNWFLGKFVLTAEAVLEDNWIKTAQIEINTQTEIPRFVNDRLRLPVWSSNQHPQQGTTTLFVPEKVLKQNELRGRIVRAGNAWGVVKSNEDHFIEIWGMLPRAMEIVVLPSYRIKQ